ncbi:prolyl oligopeptidase family serine peptidase [Pedosphaera parvula]|uniref:Phospholipase/Carboxylesterase n=1 Tax=Pedosphaera parvula (strain Ellin514) TaxID=320771 RepID=B9XRH2_PEDPL|nr:prolyl oligopeptidase family serine peptidase [Pedosphaera parvula]EEF57543.1 phospholipase/Carboxylesterase [Pedosphaera parvula Ellin514]
MKKTVYLLLAVATALTFTSCSTMKKQATAPAKPNIENLTAKKSSQTFKTDYLLYLPKDYKASSRKKWPAIVFLHGSGERGTNIWKATTHGPTKYIEKNPDFPFILITPLCPAGHKWSDDVVLGILDQVIDKYNVDTNRVYLTGLSMGGYGTWSLATTYPERFAAVAPICGGEGNIGVVLSMMDKEKKPALLNLPVWAFHGGKDNVVSLEESERMVKILKKAGCKDVELTIYPEATHNSWTATYDNPKLYEWFLEHKRSASN